ncbi:vesicular glutamate transporter 2.2-like [Planococcus citri]|uniref:vesicular glutamate transporter 2.2-like n=1 Tax=Planococcus citri TaxID=170843 RepID=UPI0031F8D882
MHSKPPNFFFSKRHLVAILVFFGMLNLFALRANLSIAIVDMTSNHTTTIGNQTVTKEPDFDWDSKTKGMVISLFGAGFAFGVFGASLSIKIGGTRIFGIGLTLTGLITLLTPAIVRANFQLFCLARFLEGVLESFTFVSIPEIWSKWAPLRERSKLFSYGYTGVYVGTAVAYPLCGYFMYKWDWSAAFYATGGMTIIWSIFWFSLISVDPSKDKFISKKEAQYLKQNDNIEKPKNDLKIWKKIFTSKPSWALCCAKFTYGVGFTVVVICLPMYIKDTTNVNIGKIGILSALPNVVSIFTLPFFGWLTDYVQNKNFTTVTKEHKIFMSVGFISGAILLFIVSFTTNFNISIISITIFKAMSSLNYLIIHVSPLYLAPKCSSMLSAFNGLCYSFSTASVPTVVGFLVTSQSKSEWNTCFLVFGSVLILGTLIYVIFGSSEPQPWSYVKTQEDRKNSEMNKN